MSVRRSKPTSRPTIWEMVRGLRKVRSKAERYVCAKLGDRANWYNQRQHQRFHGSNTAFDRSPNAATASGKRNLCVSVPTDSKTSRVLGLIAG
ncbi:hypothetical protein QUB20_16420 [Microcoleus sp. B4-C2]